MEDRAAALAARHRGGMTLQASLPPDITNLTEILRTRI
jgi:hypothetical protein